MCHDLDRLAKRVADDFLKKALKTVDIKAPSSSGGEI
jgi:hypothetical protein